MSRINHVTKIGETEGSVQYYIEDYAYTYLKKQQGKEKAKYFLYGEKEESGQNQKIYIYGIAEKPKMEQTYFKEYYPLGFLRIKGDEKIWITLKGQEHNITGYYIFYAPNQAMQEYLVENHKEEKEEDKQEQNIKRQVVGEGIPVKEVAVSTRKYKSIKTKKQKEGFIYPLAGGIFAIMMFFFLTSAEGQNKLEIFKQVITNTLSHSIKSTDEEFIIEETKIPQKENIMWEEEDILPETEFETNLEESLKEAEVNTYNDEEVQEKEITQQESAVMDEKNLYEEYIIEKGDTLASICKNKYGTLLKMEEICHLNNIENANHIEPGQKIYLPR